jgi:5-formyltetrahydrofolate cyclo-ligase
VNAAAEQDFKRELRRRILERRRAIGEHDVSAAGEAISERLASLVKGCLTIATFMPVGGEPGFAFALHRMLPDRRLVYPVCGSSGRSLSFHDARVPPSRMARWGILEPEPDAPEAAAEQIDAFVCPGIAFDKRGGRLGLGAGYYDRFLCRKRPDALLIGIGYDWQLVDRVPMEVHDVPVHYFVSPSMTLRTRAELRATKLLEIP